MFSKRSLRWTLKPSASEIDSRQICKRSASTLGFYGALCLGLCDQPAHPSSKVRSCNNRHKDRLEITHESSIETNAGSIIKGFTAQRHCMVRPPLPAGSSNGTLCRSRNPRTRALMVFYGGLSYPEWLRFRGRCFGKQRNKQTTTSEQQQHSKAEYHHQQHCCNCNIFPLGLTLFQHTHSCYIMQQPCYTYSLFYRKVELLFGIS